MIPCLRDRRPESLRGLEAWVIGHRHHLEKRRDRLHARRLFWPSQCGMAMKAAACERCPSPKHMGRAADCVLAFTKQYDRCAMRLRYGVLIE